MTRHYEEITLPNGTVKGKVFDLSGHYIGYEISKAALDEMAKFGIDGLHETRLAIEKHMDEHPYG
jgi:hypothetical protein